MYKIKSLKYQTIFWIMKNIIKFRDYAYYWLKNIYILKFNCLRITLIEGNNKLLLV